MIDAVLVDTSVWINFFKGNSTNSSLYLKQNLSNILIATCPIIMQEVLQGIKSDKDFIKINTFFEDTIHLTGDQYELSINAAKLYRRLRRNGITIRKPNDCLIAAYALKNKISLLHDDKDFENIAANSELKIIKFPQ